MKFRFLILLASISVMSCAERPVTLECASRMDCEDGNSCTDNPCNESAADPVEWFCEEPSVLDDGALCDLDFGSGAQDGFCSTPENQGTACNDENECTIDSCDVSGAENACVNDGEAALDAACDFGGAGVCDGQGVCGECNDNADCSGSADRPLCRTEVSPRVCVECLEQDDCDGNPGGPNCNIITKQCDMGCDDDTECASEPGRPKCFVPGSGSFGSCVECITSADCSGATPFCLANQCTQQPTFQGAFTLDCAALGVLPVNNISVIVEAIPQGTVTAGEPIDIEFRVVETSLTLALLQAFADSDCSPDPEEVARILPDGAESPPGTSRLGQVSLAAASGGTGSAVANTRAQDVEIDNPLTIPDLATGTGTFTPAPGATTLSIGLDAITMHLLAPAQVCGVSTLLVPVECPCADLASPPAMCGLGEPVGTIDITVEN